MKLSCAIIFALVASFSPAVAQVTTAGLTKAENLDRTVYGLGFTASAASGLGVSFRAHLPSKLSLQGVFGIIKTSDKLLLSIGGEGQYDLVRGNLTRFYICSAASYFYEGSGGNEIGGPFRIGVGVGGEFYVRESFHVSVGGMFVYFSDGTILPLPEISCHYYFF